MRIPITVTSSSPLLLRDGTHTYSINRFIQRRAKPVWDWQDIHPQVPKFKLHVSMLSKYTVACVRCVARLVLHSHMRCISSAWHWHGTSKAMCALVFPSSPYLYWFIHIVYIATPYLTLYRRARRMRHVARRRRLVNKLGWIVRSNTTRLTSRCDHQPVPVLFRVRTRRNLASRTWPCARTWTCICGCGVTPFETP
jgi:hypothetical protein